MDSGKLELLKNKEKHAQSAIASQEVREHLAGFIRSKRQSSQAQQKSDQQTNNDSKQDDHPLRKTASMPTMHIPYKAQSLSRRRQMERRTTMSPLMKRKSRPRRQLLHSLDSNSTEYSSNPCILQSSQASARSLSQSSSPPPFSSIANELISITNSTAATTTTSNSSNRPSSSNSTTTATPSTMKANKAILYDTPMSFSSQQQATTNNTSSSKDEDLQTLKQQQHLKVNEAIRKTVINRTSSRGKIATAGRSLDIELNSHKTPTNDYGLNQSAANRNLAWGMFHREFHKLRLATTSDAATLRRSQSPSSSISMGLSNNLASANSVQQRQQPPRHPTVANRSISSSLAKHFSSSSSSTSSLLSAQDSLEDSSSQAIDLSSSSEASRQRQQASSNQTMFCRTQPAVAVTNQQQLMKQACNSTQQQAWNRMNYQKILQESFNQLQLCQSRDGIKRLLMPTTNQEQSTACDGVIQHQHNAHHHHQQQQQQSTTKNSQPTLKMTNSLDGGGADVQSSRDLFTSLSEQFNLSASAQNLTSLQEQQLLLTNSLFAPQPTKQQQQQPQTQSDLNNYLLSYNPLVGANDDNRQQQQTSTGGLLSEISGLPEPYRSVLLNQALRQQQLRLLQQSGINLADTSQAFVPAAVATTTTSVTNPSGEQDGSAEQRPSVICRALSSPLLIDSNNTEIPMQSVEFDQRTTEAYAPTSRQQTRDSSATIELCSSNLSSREEDEPLHDNLDKFMITGRQTKDSGSHKQERQHAAHDHHYNTAHQRAELFSKTKSKSFYSACMSSRETNDIEPLASRFNNQHSLDLTTTTTTSTTNPKLPTNRPLNAVSYSSSNVVNCSFIYNPIFDQNSSTGVIYELEMCNHKCICGNENNHPENSFRILAIWRRLFDRGLLTKCARIDGRRATLTEIQLCHSETYSNYFGKSPYERIKLSKLDLTKLSIEGLTQLECGGQGADIDTAWNEEQTPGVARLAAGCVIEAATNVAEGRILNAFAIVRPPGHHAEHQQAMGFCFFNSIAITTRVLLTRYQVNRILIVDWDVHHGNGIQKAFYEDKNVMYISLHRHDKGNFFPGTGDIKEIGLNQGEGFNWNIAWSSETMGDAEYLAAFRTIVMPIAREFNPSMVLVACGFDAARGHPFNFGGYNLTPACFAHMTRQLMTLANGRLVLCLEGGYQLNAICDCSESCLRALLNESNLLNETNQDQQQQQIDQLQESELRREPNQSASEILYQVSSIAIKYWPSVARWRRTIEMSALQAADIPI